MLVNYKGYDIVVDEEADLCQLAFCYENGMNCYNCFESFTDGCPLDNLDMDEIYELAKNI